MKNRILLILFLVLLNFNLTCAQNNKLATFLNLVTTAESYDIKYSVNRENIQGKAKKDSIYITLGYFQSKQNYCINENNIIVYKRNDSIVFFKEKIYPFGSFKKDTTEVLNIYAPPTLDFSVLFNELLLRKTNITETFTGKYSEFGFYFGDNNPNVDSVYLRFDNSLKTIK